MTFVTRTGVRSNKTEFVNSEKNGKDHPRCSSKPALQSHSGLSQQRCDSGPAGTREGKTVTKWVPAPEKKQFYLALVRTPRNGKESFAQSGSSVLRTLSLNTGTPGAEKAALPTTSQTEGHRKLRGERHNGGGEEEKIQQVLHVINRFLGTGTHLTRGQLTERRASS